MKYSRWYHSKWILRVEKKPWLLCDMLHGVCLPGSENDWAIQSGQGLPGQFQATKSGGTYWNFVKKQWAVSKEKIHMMTSYDSLEIIMLFWKYFDTTPRNRMNCNWFLCHSNVMGLHAQQSVTTQEANAAVAMVHLHQYKIPKFKPEWDPHAWYRPNKN